MDKNNSGGSSGDALASAEHKRLNASSIIDGVEIESKTSHAYGLLAEINSASIAASTGDTSSSAILKSPPGKKPNLSIKTTITSERGGLVSTESGAPQSSAFDEFNVGDRGLTPSVPPSASRSAKKRSRSGTTGSDSGLLSSPRASANSSSHTGTDSAISSMLYFGGGQIGYPTGTLPISAGANVRQLPALLCHRVINGLLMHGRLSLASLLSLVPDTGCTSNRDHIMQILELLCVMGVVQCIVVRLDANLPQKSTTAPASSSSSSSSSSKQQPATECVYSLVGHIKGSADVPMLSGKLLEAIQVKDANTAAIRKRVAALSKLSRDFSGGHNAAGSHSLRQKKRCAAGAIDGNSADRIISDFEDGKVPQSARDGSAHQQYSIPERMALFKSLVDSFLVSDASLQDDHLYRALEQGGLVIGGGRHR